MSEEKSSSNDPKAKFREALEKKKNKGGSTPGAQGASGPKIGQGQEGAGTRKMFRRKAGG
jgi:hypothetical protein